METCWNLVEYIFQNRVEVSPTSNGAGTAEAIAAKLRCDGYPEINRRG
jgi:hypothetical protein